MAPCRAERPQASSPSKAAARLRPYICLIATPCKRLYSRGAGAWRSFPLRLGNVPLMEGMRCSGSRCRRLVPSTTTSYGTARRGAFQRPVRIISERHSFGGILSIV